MENESLNNKPTIYQQYQIHPVFQCMTSELKEQVLSFWMKTGAFDPLANVDLQSRVSQICCLIRDETETVVGVTSAYKERLPRDGKLYYFYRVFIDPEHRGTQLRRFVAKASRELLAEHAAENVEGMIIVTDNPKLMRPGMKRFFEREGYAYRGATPKGLDVWAWYFK